jgi:hypothetical protein
LRRNFAARLFSNRFRANGYGRTPLQPTTRPSTRSRFASVRVVTPDIEGLAEFYQKLSGIDAVRLADGFAEIRFEGSTFAISSERLIKLFNVGAATAAVNKSAILEFEVEDVDAVFERMRKTRTYFEGRLRAAVSGLDTDYGMPGSSCIER